MKTILSLLMTTSLITFVSLNSVAANPACEKLKKACSNVGFIKGDAKTNKGMIKNCLEVLLNGGSVPGVTVSPQDIQSCKVKKR